MDGSAASDGAADPVRTIDVECAIAALPDGLREVVVLHDIEGYSHREIGARLGIRPGSSKSRLSRAREALRRRLNSGGES